MSGQVGVLVMLLAGAVAPLRAQETDSLQAVPPDTSSAQPDTTATPGERPTSSPTDAGTAGDSVAIGLQPDADAASFLQAPQETTGIGPGGAFWRSLLIPGWGHAAVGAYSRGAFYFAAATGVGFMILKSASNRGAAQRVRDARAERAADALAVAGTLPDSIPILVLEDPEVIDAQALVDTRAQQVQDWIAAGAFLLLINGADAFVSAHLIDFPEPLEIEALPNGRVELGVSVPLPGPG